jgi:hypothetical protein
VAAGAGSPRRTTTSSPAADAGGAARRRFLPGFLNILLGSLRISYGSGSVVLSRGCGD